MEVSELMKKFIAILTASVMVLAMAIPAMAVTPGTANQNSRTTGSYTEHGYTIVAHGNGNSLAVSLLLNREVVDTTAPLRLQNKGTYPLAHGDWEFFVTVQGNKITAIVANNVYVCVDLCEGECGLCLNCGECECPEAAEPIEVNLGFIGHYLHDGRVLTTSFYWQELNEGDMIDWVAVEAAYAGWVAQGGLAPDTSNGWQSSGFAPIFFADGAAVGHGDFSFAQLEGFYRAYFVATGYLLPAPPYVCTENCECVAAICCDDCVCEDAVDVCCDDRCKECSFFYPGKGCEDCEGNSASRTCDGSGILANGRRCSQ
jgi:hypothetical protein